MTDRGKQLGERLRGLRQAGLGGEPVTQGSVALVLRKSVPLISSWEKGKAMPSEEWLHAYARFFATPRSFVDGRPRLLPLEDLRGDELDRFERLFQELLELRSVPKAPDDPSVRSPWEGMWHFADRSPITVVCARLPAGLRPSQALSTPESPDYVELNAYADLDALMELHTHVYAANPGVSVHRTLSDELTSEDVTNHLVLLGGVDWNPMTRRVQQSLDLPVAQHREADGPEGGSFQVCDHNGQITTFRSTMEGEAPYRRLIADVAQFCRAPNPFNRKRSVTICNGISGRGTYAAVRTLTDPRFRDRNRAYLEQRYGPEDAYSILARVDIVAGEVITPDWTRDGTVLHEWSSAA
jgi:hypothetical protein